MKRWICYADRSPAVSTGQFFVRFFIGLFPRSTSLSSSTSLSVYPRDRLHFCMQLADPYVYIYVPLIQPYLFTQYVDIIHLAASQKLRKYLYYSCEANFMTVSCDYLYTVHLFQMIIAYCQTCVCSRDLLIFCHLLTCLWNLLILLSRTDFFDAFMDAVGSNYLANARRIQFLVGW